MLVPMLSVDRRMHKALSLLQVGQINTSTVPRGIAMVSANLCFRLFNLPNLRVDEGQHVELWVSRYTVCFNSYLFITHDNPRAALADAIGDPVQGLYTSNASAPTGQEAGLRQLYQFGLYSYCAYIDHAQGTCTNTSAAFQLQPFKAVLSDMPANYSGLTQGFVPDTLTLTNDHYLGEFSKAAYYLLLIGTICAFLAMVMCECRFMNENSTLIAILQRHP